MKPKLSFNINCSTVSLQLLYIFSLCSGKWFFCDLVAALNHSESPCGITNLTDFKGTIRSPNYPSVYPNKIQCKWRIHSPADSVLKINIVDLDMVKDHQPCKKGPCCSQQGLVVPTEGGRGSRLLCGRNSINETIMVSQPVTVIEYFSKKLESDDDKNLQEHSAKTFGRGFEITYSIDVQACKPHELECMNGKCVLNDSLCNNIDDCGDGSDERYCPRIVHISNYDVHFKKIGNNIFGCQNGWKFCPLSQGHCYSPEFHSCDGKFDCPKGDDEIGCGQNCPEQISCSSGDGCYFPSQRCNSIRNCRDNSDETDCPYEPCSALQFTCLNGACISGSKICNGDDDCGDFSDEENCTKSSFLTVAIMGLLSCVFLFCIGLSCLYRVYAARLRAAGFAHQLEPEPIDDDFVYREPPPAYSVAVGDSAVIPYPDPQFMERYFESDQVPPPPPPPPPPLHHRTMNVRHNRRRHRQGGPSEPAVTPRSRPRPSSAVSAHGTSNLPQFTEAQNQPKLNINKNNHLPERSNFNGVIELLGFQDMSHYQAPLQQTNILQSRSYQIESPCSSPSLSPSRESVTSSTSLEDHDDLVRSC